MTGKHLNDNIMFLCIIIHLGVILQLAVLRRVSIDGNRFFAVILQLKDISRPDE